MGAAHDNHGAIQQSPACGGYIIVGPDTFGHIDPATGRSTNTDSGIETDYSLQRSRDRGNVDNGLKPQNSDLAITENGHRQPVKERVTADDTDQVDNVRRAVPSVENDMQGNTVDSTPVTNYAVIVGMDSNELGGTESCLLDRNSLGKAHDVSEHSDNDLRATDELPTSQSVFSEEQHDGPSIPFAISSPPLGYSMNSGGYLAHSELLGAAPAL